MAVADAYQGGLTLRTLRLAIKTLLLQPVRSGLTVLGILIGISSVIWLLAIGEGISQASQRQIASLGAQNIIVRTIKPSSDEFEGGGFGLTRSDVQLITETIPTLDTVLPIREVDQEFRYRTRRIDGRLVGTTPDYPHIVRMSVAVGRFLSDADTIEERNHCVLAAETAEKLFPTGNPLGKEVMVDDEFYIVVGVMQPRAPSAGIGGSLAAENFARDIYIPITTLWRRIGDLIIVTKPGTFQRDLIEVSQVTLRVKEKDDVLKTAEVIRQTLQPHHTLADYGITVPLELLQQARTTQLMFILFLGLIAAISLLVGGIGIMNIMLATVTERTREIGIRRALGAKRRDIVRQFLTESVVLSVVGGLLGVVGGLFCRPLSIALRTALFELFPTQMNALPELIRSVEPQLVSWSIPLSLAISVVVGVVFGVYPAARAAQMDPITALRHD